MSYEFRSKVRTYGIYDINGYRFRSELYESEKSGLSTINTGVCVSSFDENDNVLEYYGVIKDIFKITWEGSMELELVLFDCRWFDPTPAGVRRTENLGLVEVKHTSRLSNFDPFVLASQVSPVYYLPYACKTRPDLLQWSIVYHVPPHGYLPPNGNTDESNRRNRTASNTQRTNCDDSNSSGNASQRTTGENNNSSVGQRSNTNEDNCATTQSKKRGRTKRSRTSLKVPPNGRKVQLEPSGEL
jgi:hypothetical protein